jgi:hypothetical protein
MITWFAGLRGGMYYTPTGPGNRFLPVVGPSTELRVRWGDHLISTLEGWFHRDLNSEKPDYQEATFTTQYSWNKTWAFQISGTDVRYDKTAQAMFFYFY